VAIPPTISGTGDGAMLLKRASTKITKFNRYCLHYNLVADAAYGKLKDGSNPFSSAYRPYIVAALITFDMARMMGNGVEQKYNNKIEGFASKLNQKMKKIQPHLKHVIEKDMSEWDPKKHSRKIEACYDILSKGGHNGLHGKEYNFHVGATKILHFINPNYFPIIDSNAVKALRELHAVPYKKSTQPGYSAERYVQSISVVKSIIETYGKDRFQNIEPGTPIMRVFDKLTFSYGNNW
jgi:hypothetical protein